MKFDYLNNEIRFIKSNINLDMTKEEKKQEKLKENKRRYMIRMMMIEKDNEWAKNKICPRCGLYMNLLNECDICD